MCHSLSQSCGSYFHYTFFLHVEFLYALSSLEDCTVSLHIIRVPLIWNLSFMSCLFIYLWKQNVFPMFCVSPPRLVPRGVWTTSVWSWCVSLPRPSCPPRPSTRKLSWRTCLSPKWQVGNRQGLLSLSRPTCREKHSKTHSYHPLQICSQTHPALTVHFKHYL